VITHGRTYHPHIDRNSQHAMRKIMEKRVTTLEVRMDQTAKSIDRLDRSITDLRIDMDKKFVRIEEIIDRKFCWAISVQITSMLAMMAMMGKIAQIY
jgi:uncharacterized coiled-coil protein SlyX